MSPEPESPMQRWSNQWSTVRAYVSLGIRRSVVVGSATAWMVFWGLIVRLHYRMGDLLSAAITGALFVLPAGIGLWYYLRPSSRVELTGPES